MWKEFGLMNEIHVLRHMSETWTGLDRSASNRPSSHWFEGKLWLKIGSQSVWPSSPIMKRSCCCTTGRIFSSSVGFSGGGDALMSLAVLLFCVRQHRVGMFWSTHTHPEFCSKCVITLNLDPESADSGGGCCLQEVMQQVQRLTQEVRSAN